MVDFGGNPVKKFRLAGNIFKEERLGGTHNLKT
jgi:hypothetical protein